MAEESASAMSTFSLFGKLDPETKAERMRNKAVHLQNLFSISEADVVIQDYACSIRSVNDEGRTGSSVAGKLWVTPGFLLFEPSSKNQQTADNLHKISFSRVKQMQRVRRGLFNDAMNVWLTDGTAYQLKGMHHRNETFYLLMHLWEHPASFVDYAVAVASSSAGGAGDQLRRNTALAAPTSEQASMAYRARLLELDRNDEDEEALKPMFLGEGNVRHAVDTNVSSEAKKIAADILDLGLVTLDELSAQAELIDEMEKDIMEIDEAVKKADRNVRAANSLMAAVSSSKGTSSGSSTSSVQKTSHELRSNVNGSGLGHAKEIAILWKKPDDSLVPALLRLEKDGFSCVYAATGKICRGQLFSYSKITALVLRARHFHLDIRFGGKGGRRRRRGQSRFRLMSSYLQELVTELFVRAKLADESVVFEPGVRQFDYGGSRAPQQATPDSRADGNPGPADQPAPSDAYAHAISRDTGNATDQESNHVDQEDFPPKPTKSSAAPLQFRRPARPKSKAPTGQMTVITGDQQTQLALRQQEADVDDIAVVVNQLENVAAAMGSELVRQTEQLDQMNVEANRTDGRMNRSKQRLEDMFD